MLLFYLPSVNSTLNSGHYLSQVLQIAFKLGRSMNGSKETVHLLRPRICWLINYGQFDKRLRANNYL